MTYEGKISGIGNSPQRINEITADDIATLRYKIYGWDYGVINGFAETHNTDSITLDFGVMFAYGYFGCLPSAVTLYFHKVAQTQYQFIYAELDKSTIPNTFKIKVKNNQGGKNPKPTDFRQDILSVVKTGVFQLPLYRITLNENGIAEVRSEITNYTYSRIKKTYRTTATNNISGRVGNGSYCVTNPATSDNSKKIATTDFVHRACVDYINNN